jgi:hypothetical protein
MELNIFIAEFRWHLSPFRSYQAIQDYSGLLLLMKCLDLLIYALCMNICVKGRFKGSWTDGSAPLLCRGRR